MGARWSNVPTPNIVQQESAVIPEYQNTRSSEGKMDKKIQILTFIREELLDDEAIQLSGTTSLFEDRLLDSLNLLSLVTFWTETFSPSSYVSVTFINLPASTSL